MDPLTAITILAIGVGGPLVALFAVRRWVHPEAVARRRARHVQRVTLDRLTEGVPARVHGQARALGEVTKAPLSGRGCVAWTVEIRSRVAAEADALRLVSPDWDLLTRVQGGVPFLLDDGAGVARVEASGATLGLGSMMRFARGLGAELSPSVDTGLRALAPEPLPASFRVVERVLQVDDAVEVVGVPRREPGEPSDGGYRGADDRWALAPSDSGETLVLMRSGGR